MQTIADESYDDMWSDLISEFDQGEEQPLALELPEPPNRQRTVGVANLQSLFSGYYPTLAICLVAGLAGLANLSSTLLLAVTCLLAFILAAVFAPLMRGPRRGWWYYSLTALLLGGVGELTVAVSDGFLRYSLHDRVNAPTFILQLQRQMESFYSLGHWFLYLLLGLGVAHLTHRFRARAPWMDSPPTGRLHGALAAALISLPLLLPFGCFAFGSLYWQETDWYHRTQLDNPGIQETRAYYSSGALAELWDRAVPGHAPLTERFQHTTLPVLREVENTYLKADYLRPRPARTTGMRDPLESLLWARKADLDKPYLVARTMIKNSMAMHRLGGIADGLPLRWEFLLETLTTHQLAQDEAQSLLQEFQDYDENILTPLSDVDRCLLNFLSNCSPYGDLQPSPVNYFGVPVSHSPEQLYFLYSVKQILDWWLQERDTLLALDAAQQLAAIRKMTSSVDFNLPRWFSSKPYDQELRPLWRAAAVLTASQLYKLENGSWPEQISDLNSHLWFQPENLSLHSLAEGLQIQDNSSNQSWVLR